MSANTNRPTNGDSQAAASGTANDVTASIPLSPNHWQMLHDESGLSVEIITQRGYRTVDKASDLLELRFAKNQCRTAQLPGLLVPIYAPDGGNGLYQYRPDNARVIVQHDKPLLPDGTRPNKVIKYETPTAAQLRIDCPPMCRPMIGDISTRLFITEGVKKADSIAQHGECVIAFVGVWNWRDKRGPLPDFEYIALRGRQVVIVYDNDVSTKSAVYQAMLRLKRFLESRGAIVKVIYLPNNDGAKLGVDDYLAQGHSIADLLALSAELRTPDVKSKLNESVKQSSNPDLPGIIVTGRQLRDVTAEALDALAKRNHPAVLFVRTGKVARVVRTERETPQVEDVPLPAMRVMLSQSANFFAAGRDNLSATHPPRDVAEGILNLGQWPFPPLLGVVTCPQIRPDGSILDKPGYDAISRVIYAPLPGLNVGTVPMSPTSDDVRRAVYTITEPFEQFPFVSEADRANFIGLLLTPVMRTAIRGPVPLALITATTPGTGKSLLARAVIRIATGTDVSFANWPEDDTELRKFITSALRGGGMFTAFDNVSRTMRSDVLSQVLTVETWQDRILGHSETAELPNRAIWLATGNNLEIAGDLARRCYRIALDANLPRPWERGGFAHRDLIGDLSDNRGAMLDALLTVARAWYAAACPSADVAPLGSFEEWARIIGGILQHAGICGFLANRADLYADTDSQEWEAFLTAWYSRYGDNEQKLGDVVAALSDDEKFAATLPSFLQDSLAAFLSGNSKVKPSSRLGKALRKVHGRLFGSNDDWYTVKSVSDTHSKTTSWRVERGNSAGCAGCAESKVTQSSFENRHTDNTYVSESGSGGNSHPHTPHTPQTGIDDLPDVEVYEADAWLNVMPD